MPGSGSGSGSCSSSGACATGIERDGVIFGTNGGDSIIAGFTDENGDQVDAGDALLPGEVGDDDIIFARDGDDTIEAGNGNDEIYAGTGHDDVKGGHGNDYAHGGSGNDDIEGNGGDDSLVGGPGADTIAGGSGNDDIAGGIGNDDLSGGNNDDLISGGFGKDTIDGDSGDDTIYGGAGKDCIDGGTGDDLLVGGAMDVNNNIGFGDLAPGTLVTTQYLEKGFTVYSDDPFHPVMVFDGANPTGGDNDLNFPGNGNMLILSEDRDASDPDDNGGGGKMIFEFENPANVVNINVLDMEAGATLSLYDADGNLLQEKFVTTGDNASKTVWLNQDNVAKLVVDLNGSGAIDNLCYSINPDQGDDGDKIDGRDGDDTIIGDGGDDTITGGDGSDSVEGGDGNDDIDTSQDGDPAPDIGYPGLYGPDGDPEDDRDFVDGGDGDDTIKTGDDADTIIGGDGNDDIDGGVDADEISGGDGEDTIIGGEGSDTITGGDDDDLIYGGLDPAFPDIINITDEDTGGFSPDLAPDNGKDSIDGGDGNDTIFGQDDDDTIFGGDGNDVIDAGIDDDEVSGGDGDDLILGGQGADDLSGDDGQDLIIGGEGTDTVSGGDGNDALFGGFDEDVDVVRGGDDRDIIGAAVNDTIDGGSGGDDFDTLVVSGPAVVNWTGGDPSTESGTVTFYDNDLNIIGTAEFEDIEEVVAVGGGASVLSGGDVETVDGVVDGTDGDDVIDIPYLGDPEGDRVDSDDAVSPLTGEQDVVRGFDGDDLIYGREDNDLLLGGDGNDTIFGNEDGDGLDGGAGNDSLDGGEGSDIVAGGEGDDTISGSNDVAGDSNDILLGDFGDDTFIKPGDGDFIDGGEDPDGNDIDVLDLTGVVDELAPGGYRAVNYVGGDPLSEAGTVEVFNAGGTQVAEFTFENIEQVICFTPGTAIATARGEVAVENLQPGDRVITRDNGIQEIAWMGSRTLGATDLAQTPKLRPVLVRAGSLGNGLPERDVLVSPNHRVLVNNDKTALYFEEREVLVAAKHLTDMAGVDRVDASGVTYIHMMFEHHEVVLSNGAWTESFQPGDYSLDGLGDEQRGEIFALFPELQDAAGLRDYASARRALKKHEAQLLTSG